MIPGDIDLTQNLDFRNTIRKEIPQLPDIWKNKPAPKNSLNHPQISMWHSSANYSTSWTIGGSTNYTTTTITMGDSTVYYYDSSGWNTIYTTTYSPYSITTWNIDDTEGMLQLGSYNGTSSTTSRVTMSLEYNPKCDVFGNEIPKKLEIPDIPWNHYITTERIPHISWKTHHARKFEKTSLVGDGIPWDMDLTKEITQWRTSPSRQNRIKSSIAWLSDKSESFINNYLNPDNKSDLSYLTNMRWLNIRDAVID